MKQADVKICGLTRHEDAALAARAGARYGGVILAPGGKRSITADDAALVFEGLPLARVGVFVDAEVDRIRRAAETAGLDVVQLHGSETPHTAAALRAEGRWRIWKAIRPREVGELLEALELFQGSVDGLLLDGWSATAPGGTGARFPWEEIAPYRDRVAADLELVVAGGLDPDNVGRALSLLRPDVVDVSSGVELSPGIKDPAAVPAFIEAVRRAALHPS